MPFCSNCGAQAQPAANFCGACGRTLTREEEAVAVPQAAGVAVQTLPYRISATRVLLMSVLSSGLYLLYWFYLTWKQYRDHTRTEAYPVWHALTLAVPIYGLFRTHAHMRSFKELMLEAGLPNTISPGWAVVLVLISSAVDSASFMASGGFRGLGQEMTQGSAVVIAVIEVISIAVVAGLLLNVQGNLNRYWASQGNVRLTDAGVGVGEVVFAFIGVLSWIITLLSLVNPTYWFGV